MFLPVLAVRGRSSLSRMARGRLPALLRAVASPAGIAAAGAAACDSGRDTCHLRMPLSAFVEYVDLVIWRRNADGLPGDMACFFFLVRATFLIKPPWAIDRGGG